MSKFIPVMGTSDKIFGLESIDGYTYFETDTGKIYVDVDGERVAFGGGGVEIFYGLASEVSENVDGSYGIKIADLEDPEAKPGENDLILNSDGRFFKVVYADYDAGTLACSLIAVSGTGGGGGGDTSGGGGGETGGATVRITPVAGMDVQRRYVYGQPANAAFLVTASEDSEIVVNVVIKSESNESKTLTYSVANNEELTVDIGSNLYLGLNLITVTGVGANTQVTSNTRRYTQVSSVQMVLQESQDFNPLVAQSGSINFRCMPVGEGVDMTLKIYLDGDLHTTLTSVQSGRNAGVDFYNLTHGYHTIKAELSTGSGAATIKADPLEYEVCYVAEGEEAPIIWMQNYPEEITNHDKLIINFKVYNPTDPARSEVRLFLNQVEIPTSPMEVGYIESNLSWDQWIVTNYQLGTNILTISTGEGTVSREITIVVKKDELRNLDIIESGLFLNLDSKGRSNKENKTSRSTWTYTTADGKNTTAVQFNNFNWYNNGWILDENNDSCLRIGNGASISIPLDVLYSETARSLTFEFQFKLRNVQSLSTLIRTESYENEKGEVIVTKEVSTTDSVFCKYYNQGAGFCLGTQEAFFTSTGNTLVNCRYTDGQIVNLTFVLENANSNTKLMYVYLNGVMSGIAQFGEQDKFNANVKEMVFNSDYCDIDLYKVRVYNSQLTLDQVVQNYIADKASAELYDVNQIVDYVNNIPVISFNKVQTYNALHPDTPTQPYAILEISQSDQNPNDEKLPFVKGGKRKLDVTFVNPSLDYALSEGHITGAEYISGCPSFTAIGAEFDVQGTSSQGYPRRNYKGKFKGASSWVYTNGPLQGMSLNDKNEYEGKKYSKYYMDNKDAGERTFTWKADYMESSNTHNTGFASFVKTLYSKHPLNDYIPGYNMGDHRTTVYGFPMMVFQKKHNGTYDFIGRYNFNLDKGCNNVIDFENSTKHPFVEGTFEDDGEIKPLDFAHVAECWELCNNQHTRCSFQKVDFAETNKDGELTVLDDFEYRYHYNEDDIDAAIDGDTAKFPTQGAANTYLLKQYSNLEKLCIWLDSTNPAKATNEAFESPITFGTGEDVETFDVDTADYRRAKFRYEFTKHFDPEYCYVYFIMTELLLQYDSRGKNMMLATWGPKEAGGEYIWYPIFYDIDTQLGVNNSGVPTWEYDTDATKTSQFSTADSVLWNNLWACFSTPIKNKYIELRKSLLTIENLNGYYDFNPEISKSYAMRGSRPINVINVDEYFKYIAPAFTGYTDTTGNTAYTALYFYCLQGTRELHRKMFLRNRFNYIDSEWLGGAYSQEAVLQELKIRYNANEPLYTSDKFVTVTKPDNLTETEKAKWEAFEKNGGQTGVPYKQNTVDADIDFTIKPYLNQYVSMYFDDTPTNPIQYKNTDSITIEPSADIQKQVEESPSLSQQLIYFGGAEYISSFGDLSLKYPNEFAMNKASRLKDLYIGNEDPSYYNDYLQDSAFDMAAGLTVKDQQGNTITNPYAKTLLETVVLTNLRNLSASRDLTSCEKLKTFRALGTQIGGVSLSDGVPVETLYLPSSTTFLNLTEPVALDGLLTARPVADGEGNFPKGLYIEGTTDAGAVGPQSVTKLNSIDIKGGNMGYTSYNLLNKAVEIKEQMQQNATLDNDKYSKEFRINMEDVKWSPYRLVASGESVVEGMTYVKKTEHYTFEPYTVGSDWDNETLNSRIYEVDVDKLNNDSTAITSLELLDKFIESYHSDENYFRSTVSRVDRANTIPYISGNIFVNNPSSQLISETDIKNKYGKKEYYPDLNIFVSNVRESYVAKFVEIQDNGVEYTWDTLKYEPGTVTYPTVTEVIPTKLHYDFKGWTDTPGGTTIVTDFSQYQFSESNTVYIFYAVFERHPYKVYFKNWDKTDVITKEVLYGDSLVEAGVIPYKDEIALALEERYTFKGWTDDPLNIDLANENNLKDIIKDVTSYKATKDYTFYAIFLQESVYKETTPLEYFNFIWDDVAYAEYLDNSYNLAGWRISVKDGMALSGKVTLPIYHTDSTGKSGPVVVLDESGFNNETGKGSKITHVFFDKNSGEDIKIRLIDNYCFNADNSLVHIEWPSSLRKIGQNSFISCKALTSCNFSGTLLSTIASSAFNQAYCNAATEFILPGSLYELGDSAFTFFAIDKGVHPNMIIGSISDPSNLTIVGNRAIRQNTDKEFKDLTIYVTAEKLADIEAIATDSTRMQFIGNTQIIDVATV